MLRGKPVGGRAEDFHALDALRRALLEGGGIILVRDGGDGADVFVGGEGGGRR